jgi:hypothetical protein
MANLAAAVALTAMMLASFFLALGLVRVCMNAVLWAIGVHPHCRGRPSATRS